MVTTQEKYFYIYPIADVVKEQKKIPILYGVSYVVFPLYLERNYGYTFLSDFIIGRHELPDFYSEYAALV